MSENILRKVDSKLSTLIRLISLDIVRGRPLGEQIELLNNAGLAPAEIAVILGQTPNNIRVQLHQIRKKRESKAATEEKTNGQV